MRKLSTGMDSTLSNWLLLCTATFGPESAPTKMIAAKIAEQGPDAEVIADERQLLWTLGQMFVQEMEGKK